MRYAHGMLTLDILVLLRALVIMPFFQVFSWFTTHPRVGPGVLKTSRAQSGQEILKSRGSGPDYRDPIRSDW